MEIKKKGDAVYFEGLADPTIATYTGADITYEGLHDSRITLLVDKADYYGFKVTDIEKVQAEMDLKTSQVQRAAYGLARACDVYITGLYAQAGTVATPSTPTVVTIMSVIAQYQQILAENNVPLSEMWMIIPPWVKTKLMLGGIKFQIKNGVNGTGSSLFTDELGLEIHVSNAVKNTGSIASPVSYILAGSKNAIAFADQITDTEEIRLEKTFDTACRGLHTYGAKVIKPLELVYGILTYAAETTI
jgi:hypothetical protein